MNLLLKNLRWVNHDIENYGDIRIRNGRIAGIGKQFCLNQKEVSIDFDGHYLYPALVNAHDHFELNLFPRLGRPPYASSLDWALDIHSQDAAVIKALQKVPLEVCLWWSAVKNLISGVSVAVHHNSYHALFDKKHFPIRIVKRITWAHSLYMDKKVSRKLFKNGYPFVFHAAEGFDEKTFSEIDQLDAMGILNANTVLVHGVALSETQIEKLALRRVSLVWCPSSNLFLFKRTAPMAKLKSRLKVALGTDSTASGSPTLWEEMHAAHRTGLASPKEIFQMASSNAVDIFKLSDYSGLIKLDTAADLLILPIRHANWWENLVASSSCDMKLLLHEGSPRVVDSEICPQIGLVSNMRVNKVAKWISLDVKTLMERIRSIVPKNYLQQNPLWTMIEA